MVFIFSNIFKINNIITAVHIGHTAFKKKSEIFYKLTSIFNYFGY